MMGIAQKVARNFSDAVRSRGQSYFTKGRVSLMSAKPNEVVARVRGTTKYRVRVRLRGSKLLASCTLPVLQPPGGAVQAPLGDPAPGGLAGVPPVRPELADPPDRRAAAPAPRRSRVGDGAGARADEPARRTRTCRGGWTWAASACPGCRRAVRPAAGAPKERPARYRGLVGTPPPGDGPWAPTGAPPPARPPGPPAAARSGRARTRPAARAAKPVNRNAKRLLVYVLDVAATQTHNQVVIDLARRQRKPTGEWGPLRPWWYAPRAAHVKYDPEDRLLLALLDEAHHGTSSHGRAAIGANGTARGHGSSSTGHGPARRVPATCAAPAGSSSARTRRRWSSGWPRPGRLRLRRTEGEDDPPTMRWDDGQPWRFCLDIRTELGGKRWAWRGGLRRGENRMDLAEPLVLLPGLLVLGVGRAARFDDLGVMPWILRLRYEKEIIFVEPQQDLMLGRILAETRVPPAELVETMRLEEIDAKPRPCLTLRTPRQNWGLAADKLLGELEFDYDGAVIPAGRTTPLAVSTELGLVIRRDPRTESSADIKLFELGFREAKDPRLDPGTLELPAKRMAQVTKDLVQAGWRVEAEGKLIRPAGEFKLARDHRHRLVRARRRRSTTAARASASPTCSSAARRGETMIELGDGSMGMLPEEWLKKYGMLADLGTAENGTLRFNAVAGRPARRAAGHPARDPGRRGLREGPREPPPVRGGRARSTRRRASTASCGPTSARGSAGSTTSSGSASAASSPTTWAWARRSRCWPCSSGGGSAARPRGRPWPSSPARWSSTGSQEAAKFTPRLRVLDYTGPGRHAAPRDVRRVRPDHHHLRHPPHRHRRADQLRVRLRHPRRGPGDQERREPVGQGRPAAPRPAPPGASAARRSRTTWASSGRSSSSSTPACSAATPSSRSTPPAPARRSRPTDRVLLAKALRPFILRRTKAQVVKDLPEKTEQTLYCDMEAEQRQLLRRAARPLPRRPACARTPPSSTGPRSRSSRPCCGSARPPATPA